MNATAGRMDATTAGPSSKAAALVRAAIPPVVDHGAPLLAEASFHDVPRPLVAGRPREPDPERSRAFTTLFEAVPPEVPSVGLKDMIAVAGYANTVGLRTPPGARAERDAAVVSSLRDAGIAIRGMLDLDALAYDTTGSTSEVGPAVNALDPQVVPGGSSSGSGVAVAAGLVEYSLGTDAGGSNRIPAAGNGIVGFKPTYGRIPTRGVMPLAPSLDHVGPLARTVHDTAAVFSAIDPDSEVGRGLAIDASQEVVLGVPTAYFLDELDETTRAETDRLLALLGRADRVRLVEVDLPGIEAAALAQHCLLVSEARRVNADLLRTAADTLPRSLRLRLELGATIPDEAHETALEHQRGWRSTVDAALTGCHVLLTPTLPVAAPRTGRTAVELTTLTLPTASALSRLVFPFNLSGHPALSIPFPSPGPTVPIGVQLVGPRNRDVELLGVAEFLESVLAGSG